MAIRVDNRNITRVTAATKVIKAIFVGTATGALLVWEAIRSCFGSGMWIGAKPWLGAEGWKENKTY